MIVNFKVTVPSKPGCFFMALFPQMVVDKFEMT